MGLGCGLPNAPSGPLMVVQIRPPQAGLRPASSLRELSATRLIEVARCARYKPLIKSFMLLLGREHRDFAK